MAKFTTAHAKEAMPDASATQLDTWVKTANKANADGKTEAACIDLATKMAGNVKEAAHIKARTDGLLLLAEVGKVLSTANEEKVRAAHGHLEDVLGSLKGDKGTDTTATVLESSARARSLQLLGLTESGSESADDAARGTYVLAELLRLMGDECDEPEQMAELTTAYDAVARWCKAEADEIGTDADEMQPDMGPYYGWEAKGRDALHPSVIPLQESAPAPLLETAVRRDGTATIKIISEGWGSSGYYGKKLLQEQAPSVFKAGTQMYWDHPTRTEESDRPERSLRDLAAKLITDATYQANGPSGPGVYADAKVYEAYQPAIDELAGDIGVSIRALGTGHRGEAEGRTGTIIDSLTEAASVDFVTIAGRGGEILPLFESARARAREAQTTTPKTEDHDVDPVALKEAQDRAARFEERLLQRDAADVIAVEVSKPDVKLPGITRDRLIKSLSEATPPVIERDGERQLDRVKLVEAITAAIRDEEAYIAGLAEASGAGRVRGFGSQDAAGDRNPEQVAVDLTEAFASLGLSEAGAKLAASGRR